MTNPVRAVYKRLQPVAAVTAKLGRGPTHPYWLFQHRRDAKVEGSSAVAITLKSAGGWAPRNPHNSMQFPRVLVEYAGDPTRRANSEYAPDAETKVRTVHDEVDRVLHRTSLFAEMWGDDRVIGCQSLGEIEFFPMPDGDGAVVGQAYYGLTIA